MFRPEQFEWDEAKRLSTIKKHGLDFRDAHLLFSARTLILKSKHVEEDRFLAVGRLYDLGISVIFTMRGSVVRLITMRRARVNEQRAYHLYDPDRDGVSGEPD
jgi:uncharacterized protein